MIYPTKGRGIYVTEQLHKSFNFDINGQGIYIWTPIKNGQEPINYDNIEYKIGQYGTNANEGANPISTIDGYLGTHNTQALILYAIDLTEYIKSQSKYKSAYDIEHVLHSDIVLKDGAYRNDKSLDNIRSTEFFTNTNLETIIKRINAILYGVSRIHSYSMRDEQRKAHDKIIDAFKFGYDEFLLAAKMRFGKNFTILNVAKSLGWKNVLVLTYKPYVFSSLKDDINDHVAFEDFQIIDYKIQRELKNISDTKANIFLSSAQLMMYKSDTDELDENATYNKMQNNLGKLLDQNIIFDAIIADEYHYGGNTISFRELLDTIPHEKTIYVSGTAFKDIARGRFEDEQIYAWTYIDEQREKEQELIAGFGSHISMPTMKTHIIRISNDAKLSQSFYTEDEGFTLDKIIAYDNKTRDLLYKGSAELLLKAIAGRYGHNSLSPYRLVSGLDHTLWVLPKNTKGIIALANLMKTMSEYSGYDIIIATGNNVTQIDELKNFINRAKSNNRGSITLTCQRFKEGVTIPEWNGVFMLDGGQSLEEYYQAIFRAQSPNVSINKQYCHVFDFNPERCLSMVYDICERSDKNMSANISESIREYLTYAPILDYVDNSWNSIDINTVINHFRTHGKFSERFYNIKLNIKNLDDAIINSVRDVKKGDKKSDDTIVNTNDTTTGKTSTSSKCGASEDSMNKDISKKSLIDTIKKIRVVVSKLPEFLFITPTNEKTIEDILCIDESELFRDITGVSLDDFKYWIKKGFIDVLEINRTILNFADALEYFESNVSSESYDDFVKKNLNLKGAYCKTPLIIIKRMFDLMHIDFSDPHKRLIDPCMGTGSFLLYAKEQYMIGLKSFIEDDIERERYILENILYGYDIDIIKVNMAKILLNKNNYKCNLYQGDALRLHKEYKDMKFDYMISNPPYNSNLDLKIIKEVYPMVSDDGRMCFIHPAGWLYDKKGNKLYNSMKELFKDDLYEYEIMTAIEANAIFNIGLINSIVIDVFYRGRGQKDIYTVDHHGNSEIYRSLYTKILNYCEINNNMGVMSD